MTVDIFFVNGMPFLISLSRKLDFTAVNSIPNRKAGTVFKAFKEHHGYYARRGFRITTLHADGEFGPLQGMIEGMEGGPDVNLASANEHVPEIERRIRVVKERARAVRHSMPFNRIPKIMVIHLVLNVAKMLTHFPSKGGISTVYSPRVLMGGDRLDYKKHLPMPFGTYCQVHEEETPRNSNAARTQGAICMGHSGNLQGGLKFMTLKTGKKIVRRTWDVIPTSDTVIARVNKLGKGQPKLLTFTDRKGNPNKVALLQ